VIGQPYWVVYMREDPGLTGCDSATRNAHKPGRINWSSGFFYPQPHFAKRPCHQVKPLKGLREKDRLMKLRRLKANATVTCNVAVRGSILSAT